MKSGQELTVEYRACYCCSAVNRTTEVFCPACGKPLLLNHRYEIVQEIKSGAMGCIFKADDLAEKRTVALKQMLTTITGGEDRDYAERRFREEADILSRLHHGSLPKVFDFFRIQNPVTKREEHYLSMTFITGMTLEAVITERRSAPFPVDEALDYFTQLLNILNYLHCHYPPVLHRDLNPRNCMLNAGTVFLIDFGIARIFVPHQKGTAIGTPGYAPPEQYQGFVDQRSDIYSLGVIMHYLLTGQNPEAAGKSPFNFDNVTRHNPGTPRVMAKLIASMVEVIPDKRPQSVANIRNVLISLRKSRLNRYTEHVRKKIAAASRESATYAASLGEKISLATTGITSHTEISLDLKSLRLILPEAPVRQKASSKPQGSYSTVFEAAKKNDLEAVRDYIEKGVDINERDSDGSLLLHTAIIHGSMEIVELLLSRGADIVSVDKNGWTPLHCAAWSDSREITELLIIHGARPDVQDNYGLTPVALAEYHGKTEVTKTLGMHQQSRKPGGYPSVSGETDINDLDAVIELAASGRSIDEVDLNGNTMLHRALSKGNDYIAEFFITNRVNLNTANNYGRTPLHLAAGRNMCETALSIVTHGGKIDAPDDLGFTALHIAAKHGHTDMAELLISKGADVNRKDNRGWTALHFAVQGSDKKMLLLLISRGADTTLKDRSGKSPLDMAKMNGNIDLAKLFSDG